MEKILFNKSKYFCDLKIYFKSQFKIDVKESIAQNWIELTFYAL
jgi:hypothetical protein